MRAQNLIGLSILTIGALTAYAGCGNKHELDQQGQQGSSKLGASASLQDLMKARNLNDSDVEAALKTYVPSGKLDEYYIFASGGQSGNIDVMGVPSMRALKVIPVFTPESWSGYGVGGETDKILESGNQGTHKIRWADVHHPNLSETKGDYDGQFILGLREV